MQVGDIAILRGRESSSLVRVIRRTKTRVVVKVGSSESAFNVSTGRRVGDQSVWATTHLEAGTPETIAAVREEVARRRAIAAIRAADLNALTTEQLEAIRALLPG